MNPFLQPKRSAAAVALLLLLARTAAAQSFRLASDRPDIDRWMYPFGGGPAEAEADTDGDGSSSLVEWREGTNPTIPDAPRLRQEGRPGGRVRVFWDAAPNQVNILESGLDLKHRIRVRGPMDFRERATIRRATDLDAGSAFRCYRVRRMPSAP